MIPFEEGFYHLRTFFQVAQAIFVPAKTFFSHGSIEALNIGLLILAIWSSNPVAITEHRYIAKKICLKFWPTISLDQMYMSSKPSPHTLEEKPGTILRGQFRSQQDISLSGEDIDSCERINVTEVH